MTVADARGTLHRRCDDRTKLRIVSLVPSLTELLCDLGLGHAIVGRTGHCIHPADEVERIGTVGGTRDVDVDKIRALAPTHLVVGIDENESATLDDLDPFVPHVLVTHARKPRDNLGLYRLFGHVFAAEREADRLSARFDAAWSALEQARTSGAWPTRRVLVLNWKDPWMTIACDTYTARLLATIGWAQVDVADALDPSAPASPRHPAIDLARAARGVDIVLLASEPYPFTDTHVAALERIVPRVQWVDGELLSWYGSRAIAGLEYLGRLGSGDVSNYST